MKTQSGFEIWQAWNKDGVTIAIEPTPPTNPPGLPWIQLTPSEAREIGEYFCLLADTCERNGKDN